MTQPRSSRLFLQAALKGDRVHPAVPHTPAQIAAEALAAVNVGAQSVHVHPFDDNGGPTLAPEPCAATIRAVRATCPGISISLTSSADVEPDPQRRLALVATWTELPDLVTANQGEAGILELCELLVDAVSIDRNRGRAAVPRGHAPFRHCRHRSPLRPGHGRTARR